MTAQATIYVVDDDQMFSKALSQLLAVLGYQVAAFASGDAFLNSTIADTPGCILLDLELPGLGGFEVQKRLAEVESIIPIVFLTGHGDIPRSVHAIKAGAEDFLTKPVDAGKLADAIERALQRYSCKREQQGRLATLRGRVEALTPREREVFNLVVRGKRNKQIAYELGTTERTVKAHRARIMEKLQVRSLAEAVSIADELGLTSVIAPASK
jgi:FixJ family two-component response regulator